MPRRGESCESFERIMLIMKGSTVSFVAASKMRTNLTI